MSDDARLLVSLLCEILQGRRDFDGVHGTLALDRDDLKQFDPYTNYFAVVNYITHINVVLIVDEEVHRYATELARKNSVQMMQYIYFGKNTDAVEVVSAKKFASILDEQEYNGIRCLERDLSTMTL